VWQYQDRYEESLPVTCDGVEAVVDGFPAAVTAT